MHQLVSGAWLEEQLGEPDLRVLDRSVVMEVDADGRRHYRPGGPDWEQEPHPGFGARRSFRGYLRCFVAVPLHDQEAAHALEEAVALLLAARLRRRRQPRHDVADLRHQLGHFRGGVPQFLPDGVGRSAGHVAPQRLDERHVGDGGLRLVGTPDEHLGATQAGIDAGLLGQAGLADTGLAAHQ